MNLQRAYYQKNKHHILERNKEYARRHPEKIRAIVKRYQVSDRGQRTQRNYVLGRKYGISLEQYEAMLTQQGGRCAICGGVEPGGTAWCVDHGHRTGKVRGLLCRQCNAGLGQFRDNPSLLRAALDYLGRE